MIELTEYERGLNRAADLADGHAKMNRDDDFILAACAASSVAAFIEQLIAESFRARGVPDEDVSAFLKRRHRNWYGEKEAQND